MELTVVIPFWNGHKTIGRLLSSLPSGLPVIIVDDLSDKPLADVNRPNTRIVRMQEKGFFSGAVNVGADACEGDFLILNQDSWLADARPLNLIEKKRRQFAAIGHGVTKHRAWPNGYVQGTFMFVRRDAWDKVGQFNEHDYPLWGATAEWQLRACRQDFRAFPLENIPGFHHDETRRKERRKYGRSITDLLRREKSGKQRARLLDTPPLMSVVMPCYNYGRYLGDAVNSLIGGLTSLGQMEPQTFQSFEIVIVDDASTDDSWRFAQALADDWKAIRAIRLKKNRGTPGCLNAGVNAAVGRYIHILSADDMREHWQLERLLRTAQANPHSFAFSSVRMFKHDQRIGTLELPEYNFDKVVKRNLVPAGIVYPKLAWEEVGGYPEIMIHGREDWAFNVGMGVKGWCGVKVDGFGNLYRRERQNRSWRTGNQHKGEPPSPKAVEWRKTFVGQMQSLYPAIYRGERPVGCCGSKGSRAKVARKGGQRAAAKPLPGQKGMIVVEYVGGGRMTKTFWANRQQYRFGGNRRRGYVAVEDFAALQSQYPGKFKKYVEPKPIKMKAEPLVELADEPDVQPKLTELPGIGPSLESNLVLSGYSSPADLARAVPQELVAIKGVSLAKAARIIAAAQEATVAAS